MFLSEGNLLALERTAKRFVSVSPIENAYGNLHVFKTRSDFYNAKPKCQETSALITPCPIFSNISDKKSTRSQRFIPKGICAPDNPRIKHLWQEKSPPVLPRDECPWALSHHALGPFLVAVQVELVPIPLVLIPTPSGSIPSITAHPTASAKLFRQTHQGTHLAKNITYFSARKIN